MVENSSTTFLKEQFFPYQTISMQLLDIIFPKRCVGCGKIGRYFCLDCQSGIRFIAFNEPICPVCEKPAVDGFTHPMCEAKYGIDGLTSFFHYDGVVKKAVKAIKYRYVSDLSNEFVSLISHLPSIIYDPRSLLVPIPLHPARLRDRGFNQAESLGSLVASALHISMRTDILTRVRKTTPQASVRKRKDRLKNMDGAFAVHSPLIRNHSSVVLFDDVFTTGATMRSAANVLKRAGVKRVWAMTMAR